MSQVPLKTGTYHQRDGSSALFPRAQDKAEGRAFAGRAPHVYFPAVRFRDLFHDREAKTGACAPKAFGAGLGGSPNRPRVAPVPSAFRNGTNAMTDNIAASDDAIGTWLVDSAGNIAVSGAGLALLEAKITPLQSGNPEELDSPDKSRAEG